jgi:hypothetical protein
VSRPSPWRRLAHHLAGHAARVLPRSQELWARSMLAELGHIKSDGAALGWALGCLRHAYSARISHMRFGTLSPSRPVLALEMLVCFLPLTGVFAAAASRLVTAGARTPSWLVALLAASLLGPLGLIAALPPTLRRGAAPRRAVALVLGVPAALTAAAFGAGILPAPTWRDAVLCVLLPLAGAMHLAAMRAGAARLSMPGI